MKTLKLDTQCYHCGEPASASPIVNDDKTFCCTGCVTVYQLIHGAELGEFYTAFESAALRAKPKQNESAQFDAFDQPHVLENLLLYKSDETHRILLTIPEIACISCVWLLERLGDFVHGVQCAEVNLERKQLLLDYAPNTTSLSAILKTLATLGYHAQVRSAQKNNPSRTTEYKRLAVAGFAFGNVMLLSIPEYLHADFSHSEYALVFPALSAVFACAALFYGAADYCRSALLQLKRRAITMDVPIFFSLIALFLASFVEFSRGVSIGYFDSLTGFIFFLRVSKIFQLKAFDALEFQKNLHDLLPLAIRKKIDDGFELTAIEHISKNDTIELRQGELLPCDSELISAHAHIDNSYITGESNTISCRKGDQLFAGSHLVSRSAFLRVRKKAEHSYLNTLWQRANSSRTRQTRFTDRLAVPFILTVFGVAFATFLTTHLLGIEGGFSRAVSVLIVACPCALAISAPFCFGSVSTLLAKNGFYFRETGDIERAAGAEVLAFDKTGTLTSTQEKSIADRTEASAFHALIRAATAASLHPLSQAISAFLADTQPAKLHEIEEIPHCGIRASDGKNTLLLGSAAWLRKEHIALPKAQQSPAQQVFVAVNGNYAGYFEISAPIRHGVKEAWNALKQKFSLIILSGDRRDSAEILAAKLGGAALASELSPAAKTEWIETQRKEGKSVVMFGDGMNDAAALAASDIGVSVIENHSFFSPSADAIIEGKKLRFLPQFFGLIRAAKGVFYTCVAFSLLYNCAGIYFAVTGKLTPFVSAILMPLSSITILSIAAGAIHLNYLRYKKELA